MKFKKELIKLANKLHSYGLKEESNKIRSIFKKGSLNLSSEWQNYIDKTDLKFGAPVALAWNNESLNPTGDFSFSSFVRWYNKLKEEKGGHISPEFIIRRLVTSQSKADILYKDIYEYAKSQEANAIQEGKAKLDLDMALNNYVSTNPFLENAKEKFVSYPPYQSYEDPKSLKSIIDKKERDDEAKETKERYERAKIKMSGNFFEYGSDGKEYSGTWVLDPQTKSARLSFKGYGEGAGPSSQYNEILKKVLKREIERFLRMLKISSPSSSYGTEVRDFINNKYRLKNLDPAVMTLHEAYQKALAK